VYKLDFDYRYQSVDSTDAEFVKRCSRPVPGQSMKSAWSTLDFYVRDPTLLLGDFYYLTDFWLACGATVVEQIGDLMERDGELLPIRIEGVAGEHVLWHITRSVIALDEQKTTWEWYGKTRGVPIRYVFDPNVLSEPMLFRMPNLPSQVFAATDAGHTNADFFRRYHELGLKGLTFKPVWESA
jgi:hypothetical protein